MTPSPSRPLLDHEAPLGQVHDKSGVVEVAPLPSLSQRNDGLEETTVESNRVTACTEWQPVEIDACRELARHDTQDLAGAWPCLR